MGFIERAKQFATGKTTMERKQESAAMAEIRRKALAAQLREREKQAIKFAQEREVLEYSKRRRQLTQPKKFGFTAVAPEYTKYGSPFGQPRSLQSQRRVIKVITKGKKGKRKVRYVQAPQQQPQGYTDILGLGSLGGKGSGENKRYDVLGI